MRILVVVNRVAEVVATQTTALLVEAAVDLGHEVGLCGVGGLQRRKDGHLQADVAGIPNREEDGTPWARATCDRNWRLSDVDLVLLRTNPARDPLGEEPHRELLELLEQEEGRGTRIIVSTVQDNIVCSSGSADVSTNSGTDTESDNLTVPCGSVGFLDLAGGDFRLADASSPAHDAGGNYRTPPETDYDGVPRPQGAAVALGAFELCDSAGCDGLLPPPPPPDDTLVEYATAPDGTSPSRPQAARRQDGDAYLVYVPNAQPGELPGGTEFSAEANSRVTAQLDTTATASVNVDLTSATGTFRVQWMRAADGETLEGPDATAGAVRTLTAPWQGADVVLFLRR